MKCNAHMIILNIVVSLKEAFFLGHEMNFFDKIGWVLQQLSYDHES